MDFGSEKVVAVQCCVCGIVFAMTGGLNDLRKSDGKQFFCPNGHDQHYVGAKEEEKKEKKRKELKDKLVEQVSLWIVAFESGKKSDKDPKVDDLKKLIEEIRSV